MHLYSVTKCIKCPLKHQSKAEHNLRNEKVIGNIEMVSNTMLQLVSSWAGLYFIVF